MTIAKNTHHAELVRSCAETIALADVSFDFSDLPAAKRITELQDLARRHVALGDSVFVSRMAESQASDATIMSLAGHLSRKMMERYSHTRNEAKRQAIAVLDQRHHTTPSRESRFEPIES